MDGPSARRSWRFGAHAGRNSAPTRPPDARGSSTSPHTRASRTLPSRASSITIHGVRPETRARVVTGIAGTRLSAEQRRTRTGHRPIADDRRRLLQHCAVRTGGGAARARTGGQRERLFCQRHRPEDARSQRRRGRGSPPAPAGGGRRRHGVPPIRDGRGVPGICRTIFRPSRSGAMRARRCRLSRRPRRWARRKPPGICSISGIAMSGISRDPRDRVGARGPHPRLARNVGGGRHRSRRPCGSATGPRGRAMRRQRS